MNYEIIGITATIILIIGYFQKKEMALRLITNLGCILFIVYGFFIGAISIWLLNILIIFINTYRILKGVFKGGK